MDGPAAQRHRRSRLSWLGRLTPTLEPLLFIWMGLTVALIVGEQIAMLPPPPPTPAQVAAATPKAQADWRLVYAQLYRRLDHRSFETGPELGKVWATRDGRICGYVNKREAAVDNMMPFFTVGLRPVLRSDDPRRYFRDWLSCIGNHWVELHAGSEESGTCASRHGRETELGRELCNPEPPGVRTSPGPD